MITFFKNQTELAEALKELIDNYWELKIKETDLIIQLLEIERNNKELLYKDNEYVSIVQQRLGIKRLRVIERILKNK